MFQLKSDSHPIEAVLTVGYNNQTFENRAGQGHTSTGRELMFQIKASSHPIEVVLNGGCNNQLSTAAWVIIIILLLETSADAFSPYR
jgi:hypothetical protein